MTVGGERLTIRALRKAEKGYQIAFEGIDDRKSAEALRGSEVFVNVRRDLDVDEFWPSDLVGLAVFLESGERVGVVADVIVGGAQDRLVVTTTSSGDREIPFVSDLVPEVDVGAGRVTVASLPGLLTD